MKLEMCNINDYDGIDPFIISDRLMNDEHELVLKGYGWILKSVSQIDQPSVEQYLIKHLAVMPRVAYRYARDTLDKDTRKN